MKAKTEHILIGAAIVGIGIYAYKKYKENKDSQYANAAGKASSGTVTRSHETVKRSNWVITDAINDFINMFRKHRA